MAQEFRLHDVVALTEDVPEHGLLRGQVGTIVELLSDGHFEVEFSDDSGRAYALAPLARRQLMVLHYHSAAA
jgi:membrane protein implicated in regulation of membrane protease activity